MNILIVFYSRYGNVMKLAKAAEEGASGVEGTTVKMVRAKELASKEEIDANEHWKEAFESIGRYPEATIDDLKWADGLMFGSPTRYGNMAAPLKQFWDSTSSLWMSGVLAGKVGGCFTSSSTFHGGQESTIISMWFPMIHHGMLIAGVPYTEQLLFTTTRGGGPYGPSSVSGPKANEGPNEDELAIARALGKRVAELTKKLRG